MPRKNTVHQEVAYRPEKPRTSGRASFPAPDSGYGYALPEGFLVRHTVHDPFTEQAVVIVEGPGLPPWERGQTPSAFSSLLAFSAYLDGDRSEVNVEPAE